MEVLTIELGESTILILLHQRLTLDVSTHLFSIIVLLVAVASGNRANFDFTDTYAIIKKKTGAEARNVPVVS